ncbi:hypothetical protein Ancab_026887 [Ancistrocladus abbreviatus]
MGKIDEENRLESQPRGEDEASSSSRISCYRCCPMSLAPHFNFKCLIVLVFSLAVFLSTVFWLIPIHSRISGFDASGTVKLQATVKAYFRLQKPVAQLIAYVDQLEDELFEEVGVPDTKVVVLSLHQSGASNWTDAIFGVLPDPTNAPMNPVSLSLLKSSLIELFLQQTNLTLNESIFGQPSSFELIKVTGGITVIPVQPASTWPMPQMLFNFTLNNSIYDIRENLVELKQQLKAGLHLRSYEYVYVQVTNEEGSTINPPVTIQAAILSDLGMLLPQRLKQLAEIIQHYSLSKNLGLNNTVFGKVKSVSLSSYLEYTLHTLPPAPSPAPSLGPSPSLSPSYSLAPSSDHHHRSPCHNCEAASPFLSGYPDPPASGGSPFSPISNPPAPSIGSPVPGAPPHEPPCSSCTHSDSGHVTSPAFSPLDAAHQSCLGPSQDLSPDLAPSPSVSEQGLCKSTRKGSVAPVMSSASSSLSLFRLSLVFQLLSCITLLFHLLC